MKWAFPTSLSRWAIARYYDELLDYLARDIHSAILLYLEQLSDARRFVSAARSASRNKPILVIARPAAQRLFRPPARNDPAWDAAIQLAGLLRVR